MDSNRSRAATLIGVAAAAGTFGIAAMMSTATAPTARADDFTDVINSVDADFSAGQEDFSTAFTDFGGSDVNGGLAAFLSGVDNDLVAAPDNLYVGSLDLLANDPVVSPFFIGLPSETSFASGLSEAESIFTTGQNYFAEAATDLSSGDYTLAAELDSLGSLYDIASLQILLEGVVASF
jgi:hypothetical protein